jgi:hypothetical protein
MAGQVTVERETASSRKRDVDIPRQNRTGQTLISVFINGANQTLDFLLTGVPD